MSMVLKKQILTDSMGLLKVLPEHTRNINFPNDKNIYY